MTLLEMTAAVTVLAVIAGALTPVIHAAADVYARSVSTRTAAENTAFAMERVVRMLRDTPSGDAPGSLGLSSAAPEAITFSDGRSLALAGSDLLMSNEDGQTAPLCRHVETFQITYLADDGSTSVAGAPASTHRYLVVLKSAGVELRACVFPRVRMIQP
jgi:hypothetical protein